MKKIYLFLVALCATIAANAATEQAWYNDVKSITSGGQYYIYSVNGAGFMEANNAKVIKATTSKTPSLFTISNPSGGTVKSGNYYLKSYMVLGGSGSGSGPLVTSTGDGSSSVIWTSVNSGEFWNIHGFYNAFLADRYACLKYEDNKYEGFIEGSGLSYSKTKDIQKGAPFQWYVISQAQYACHWAIYAFDQEKEARADYTKYEDNVPADFWTALADLCTKDFDVKTTTADEVNTAKNNLTDLYSRADDVAAAYATGKAAIKALEDADKGDGDISAITNDINNAKTNIEKATSVEAINAAVVFKALAPITFQATLTFDALTDLSNIATSSKGLTVAYASSNESVVNAQMKAIYKGTATITASTAANDTYYAFARNAEVTINGLDGNGSYSETICSNSLPYSDANYSGITEAGEYTKHLTTTTGGDSTLVFTLVVNQETASEEDKTIVYGDENLWNGIALNDSAVGTHTVVFVTTNVAGCDSTVTLHLTVTKMDNYTMQQDLEFCEGDSAEYRGVWYKTAGSSDVTATGEIRDTTITVVVTVYATDYIEDSKTVTVGETFTWNENDYTIEQAGDTTLVDSLTNINGCDSVMVLNVHADVPAALYNTTNVETQSAKKVIRNGEIYILRGKDLYDLTGRKQD